jgi:phosphatidate cytidylyltransferase
MLKLRVLTALVLLALLLPTLWVQIVWPFALATGLLVAAAAWEWGRLNGLSPINSLGVVALTVALGGAAWWANWLELGAWAPWWPAAVIWLVGGAWMLRGGSARWQALPQWLRLGLGVLLLSGAWICLVQARQTGVNFVLSILALVWVADIAAYFGGKRFGRQKLAPRISPGKTWEGAVSGGLAVVVLAMLWVLVEQRVTLDSSSVFLSVLQRFGQFQGAVAIVVLAAFSVIGDLFESLVKRAVDAKDSSRLLPGHGGVLDRIDALLPVFPLAMALVFG